jgi:hypothetical protein
MQNKALQRCRAFLFFRSGNDDTCTDTLGGCPAREYERAPCRSRLSHLKSRQAGLGCRAVRAKSRAEVAGSHTEREVKEASDSRSGSVPKRGPDEQRWMTCAGSTDGMEACVRIRRHGNPVCILG